MNKERENKETAYKYHKQNQVLQTSAHFYITSYQFITAFKQEISDKSSRQPISKQQGQSSRRKAYKHTKWIKHQKEPDYTSALHHPADHNHRPGLHLRAFLILERRSESR